MTFLTGDALYAAMSELVGDGNDVASKHRGGMLA